MTGETIGGFRIESLIANGGMGAVYRARDRELDHVVALKVLHETYTSDEESVARFVSEGKLIAQLHHPSIVRLRRVGWSGSSYFLAMEFVRGKSLAEIMSQHGPMNPRLALSITKQIVCGLDYAHGLGVVHRDLKPGNILVRDDGVAKLADFGIAHSLEFADRNTPPGVVVGTPSFLAPEQCQGKDASAYVVHLTLKTHT